MRIAGAYRAAISNNWYRSNLPVGELGRRGHDIVTVEVDCRGFRPEQLAGFDVIHVYRGMEKPLLKALRQQRDRGVAIVWDNDDDPRLIPKEDAIFAKAGALQIATQWRYQVAMMTAAHLITTTSETLAERYRDAIDGGDVRVIENYIGDAQLIGGGGRHDGLVIGWVAASEHVADAQRLRIADVLRRVMERVPEVRVRTAGVRLDLDPSRYEHTTGVPFRDLASYLRDFDIGIAPLSDIPMSAARSNVKVKEYAAAGVPWLASRRGPYVGLGEREGGMLVDDGDWEDALVRLATARFKRRQLARRAKSWAKSQVITKHLDTWEAALGDAIQLAGRVAA